MGTGGVERAAGELVRDQDQDQCAGINRQERAEEGAVQGRPSELP